MKVYKLLRIKNGKLYPLFINRNQEIEVGKTYQAETHPTKGFAVRKGFHCLLQPNAPHLKTELKNGEKRIWVECDVGDTYTQFIKRSPRQGGLWCIAQQITITKVLE